MSPTLWRFMMSYLDAQRKDERVNGLIKWAERVYKRLER